MARERYVPLDVLVPLMQDRGCAWEDLRTSGIDPGSLERIKSGQWVLKSTVQKIARKLKVHFGTLLRPDDPDYRAPVADRDVAGNPAAGFIDVEIKSNDLVNIEVKAKIPAHLADHAKILNLLNALRDLAGLANNIEPTDFRTGSLYVEFFVTKLDAVLLLKAFFHKRYDIESIEHFAIPYQSAYLLVSALSIARPLVAPLLILTYATAITGLWVITLFSALATIRAALPSGFRADFRDNRIVLIRLQDAPYSGKLPPLPEETKKNAPPVPPRKKPYSTSWLDILLGRRSRMDK